MGPGSRASRRLCTSHLALHFARSRQITRHAPASIEGTYRSLTNIFHDHYPFGVREQNVARPPVSVLLAATDKLCRACQNARQRRIAVSASTEWCTDTPLLARTYRTYPNVSTNTYQRIKDLNLDIGCFELLYFNFVLLLRYLDLPFDILRRLIFCLTSDATV